MSDGISCKTIELSCKDNGMAHESHGNRLADSELNYVQDLC